MAKSNAFFPYSGALPEKTDGQKYIEAAVFGLALGVAIGAIAYYLSKKEE
jgi:hypothetical protein